MAGEWEKAVSEAMQQFPDDPAKFFKLAKRLHKENSKATKIIEAKAKKASTNVVVNVKNVAKVKKASAMTAAPTALTCGSGHTLMETVSADYKECDICDNDINAGTSHHSCNMDGFDVCTHCWHRRKRRRLTICAPRTPSHRTGQPDRPAVRSRCVLPTKIRFSDDVGSGP